MISKLAHDDVRRLYEGHAAGLRRFLLGVLRDPELAEDAMQQAFVTAAEKGHATDPDRRKAWLYQVAFRHALLLRRRQEVERRAMRVVAGEAASASPESASPAERAVVDERLARLRELIGELPREQRDVLDLRLQEQLTFAEIAKRQGCPLGTVLTRARLAMARLKARMT